MNRGLIALAIVCVALAATSSAPVSAAPRDLPAQLGFILFRKTTMAEVTARLGPGKVLPTDDPDTFIGRGWYDSAERVYLLVYRIGNDWHRHRRLKGAPPILMATLATARHLQSKEVKAGDLGRPRLSLPKLQGPRGIRLGDSRESVFRAIGAGELQDRQGDVETYNYYGLKPFAPDPGFPGGDQGFILQVTFTAGRLTRIHILEAS